MMSAPVTILVHTLNEEINLAHALENVGGWASQVCVIDSASTDKTQQIAKAFDAELYVRRCSREGLVEQRNWALDNIAIKNDWVFVLDADEVMEPELKEEVASIVTSERGDKDGYWCRFKLIFMGKWIRRSSMYPSWSLRLFRHRLVRYEKREVNSHPLVFPHREGFLQYHILNEDHRGLSSYLRRLDEFSSLEAKAYLKVRQLASQEGLVASKLFGTRAERRRSLKSIFIRLPFRPMLIFLYLYVIRLGVFEGRAGLDYAFFKAVAEWATTVKMLEFKGRTYL